MPPTPLPAVRSATPGDLDALVALEQASFDCDRLSRRQYRHHLGSPHACVLVLGEAPSGLAGAAVVLFRRGTRVGRLYSLATAPAMRGHGVASYLMAAAESAAAARGCRALRLEVRTDNHTAIALYRRHGFRCIGSRAAYYGDGGDALRFEKCLREERPSSPAPGITPRAGT